MNFEMEGGTLWRPYAGRRGGVGSQTNAARTPWCHLDDCHKKNTQLNHSHFTSTKYNPPRASFSPSFSLDSLD